MHTHTPKEISDLVYELRSKPCDGMLAERAAMMLERYSRLSEAMANGAWVLKMDDRTFGIHIGDVDSAKVALRRAHVNYTNNAVTMIGDKGQVITGEAAADMHAERHHVHLEHTRFHY